MTEMTRPEARAEARRRWGPAADVKLGANLIGGAIYEVWSDDRTRAGASTLGWAEAFADASMRHYLGSAPD